MENKNTVNDSAVNCSTINTKCVTKTKPSFCMADHVHKLTQSSKRRNHYVCPVCSAEHLEVVTDPSSEKYGAYSCLTNECERSEIRDLVAPWDGISSGGKREKKPEQPPQAIALPKQFELATVNEYRKSKVEESLYDPAIKNPLKTGEEDVFATKKVDITHWYDNSHFVIRSEYYQADGKRIDKITIPWNTEEQNHEGWGIKNKGKGSEPWSAYRIQEALRDAKGKVVLGLEGEKKTDEAVRVGLSAVTFQGSCWDIDKDLVPALERLKEGGVLGIVYLQDNDKTGIRKGLKVARACVKVNFPYLIIEASQIDTEAGDGDDLANYIAKQEEKGMTVEQIKTEIEEKVQAIAAEEAQKQSEANERIDNFVASEIRRIKLMGLSGKDEAAKISSILAEGTVDPRRFKEIEDWVEQELNNEESREYNRNIIRTILSSSERRLDLAEVLPAGLAKGINAKAAKLNKRPEVLLTYLLGCISGLYKVGTHLYFEGVDIKAHPNLFTCVVAKSGEKKSVMLRAVATDSLNKIQAEIRREWEKDRDEYKKLEKHKDKNSSEELVEPKLLKVKLDDTTLEGLRKRFEDFPHQGCAFVKDEIIGFFKSQNATRNGRGGDEEKWLEIYDCTGFDAYRATGVLDTPSEILCSIVGGTQPKILESFLRDCQDNNGKWARFLFCYQPPTSSPINYLDATQLALDTEALFRRVLALPKMKFTCSPAGKRMLTDFSYICDSLKMDEDTSDGLGNFLVKLDGAVQRLALNLHVIHYCCNNRTPPKEISGEIVLAAIKLAVFYACQTIAIYGKATASNSESIPDHLLSVIEASKKKKGEWLTAREYVNKFYTRGGKRPCASVVTTWFEELEKMRLGEVKKGKSSLMFRVYLENESAKLPLDKVIDKYNTSFGDFSKLPEGDIFSETFDTTRSEPSPPSRFSQATPKQIAKYLGDDAEEDQEFVFSESKYADNPDLQLASPKGADAEQRSGEAVASDSTTIDVVEVMQSKEAAVEAPIEELAIELDSITHAIADNSQQEQTKRFSYWYETRDGLHDEKVNEINRLQQEGKIEQWGRLAEEMIAERFNPLVGKEITIEDLYGDPAKVRLLEVIRTSVPYQPRVKVMWLTSRKDERGKYIYQANTIWETQAFNVLFPIARS